MKAEEILDKHHRLNDKCLLGIAMDSQQRTSILNAMEEYAALMLTESHREVERLKELIKHRITELNEADKLFCADRWDNTKHHMDRSLAREESNKVTFARQELERLYTAMSNQPGDEKGEG